MPDVPDLGEMCVYRGTESGFVPEEPIACPEVNYWQESHLSYYWYRVQFSDIHGNNSEFSDELVGQYPTSVDEGMPTTFSVRQNIPNPFNPTTAIAFDLPKQAAVSLRVFDLAGHTVRVLLDHEATPQGRHEAVWNGRDDSGRQVASGAYFYRLEAGDYSETKRMVLIK
jgi:hypothetical protein